MIQRIRIIWPAGAAAIALAATLALSSAARPAQPSACGDEIPLDVARIYWEYNSSDNDLGVHVVLDGEHWTRIRIENPLERVIFDVRGRGPYAELGLTELFFEGAEPSLDEVPLAHLLGLFPEGVYEFSGRNVDGDEMESEAWFSHAIPDGPEVFAHQGASDFLSISWSPVTTTPPGFPARPIDVVGYQVIVESFQVTVPTSVLSVTVPPEFVATLEPGRHEFEVLAIDASGNQTIKSGEFRR